VWFLRGRLLIGSPLLSHLRLLKNRTPTYIHVRFSGATSRPRAKIDPEHIGKRIAYAVFH